jgi:hypothetical protein
VRAAWPLFPRPIQWGSRPAPVTHLGAAARRLLAARRLHGLPLRSCQAWHPSHDPSLKATQCLRLCLLPCCHLPLFNLPAGLTQVSCLSAGLSPPPCSRHSGEELGGGLRRQPGGPRPALLLPGQEGAGPRGGALADGGARGAGACRQYASGTGAAPPFFALLFKRRCAVRPACQLSTMPSLWRVAQQSRRLRHVSCTVRPVLTSSIRTACTGCTAAGGRGQQGPGHHCGALHPRRLGGTGVPPAGAGGVRGGGALL